MNAETLNQHLASGGVVQVTSYGKSWLYEKKHAGVFVQQGENLLVKHGKRLDSLTCAGKLLVSIRKGRYA